jgi:hypothetical protein
MLKLVTAILLASTLAGCASMAAGPGAASVGLSHPTSTLPSYMPGTVQDPEFMRSVQRGG